MSATNASKQANNVRLKAKFALLIGIKTRFKITQKSLTKSGAYTEINALIRATAVDVPIATFLSEREKLIQRVIDGLIN